ncbi:MAG TPA: hypothetical protein VMW48_12195 [Vicinamibacterales bacterium]|nr:hypothetical protein [Vicinamibacterales bacterium]
MPGDGLKKVKTNDPLQIPAEFYNAAVDAIRANKAAQFTTHGAPLGAPQGLMCVAEDDLSIPFSLVRVPRVATYLNYASRNDWHPHCRIPDLPWTSEVGIAQRACLTGDLVPVIVRGLSVLTIQTPITVTADFKIGIGDAVGTRIGSTWPVPANGKFAPGPVKIMAWVMGSHSFEGVSVMRVLALLTGDRGDTEGTYSGSYTDNAGFQVLAVGNGYTVSGPPWGPVTITKT